MFTAWLEERFGSSQNWDREVLSEAMERFETVTKRTFRGDPEEDFVIPMPGLREHNAKGLKKGRLRITRKDLLPIFHPVAEEVVKPVKAQIVAIKEQKRMSKVCCLSEAPDRARS